MVQEYDMETYAFALGSHPALSAVEIVSYFRRMNVEIATELDLLPHALHVTTTQPTDARRILRALGGTPYIVRLRGDVSSLTPEALLTMIPELRQLSAQQPRLGISLVGSGGAAQYSTGDIHSLGMNLKRTLHARGLHLMFPRKTTALTSAQLFHGKFPEAGIGLVLFPSRGTWRLGTVEAVQDIRSYARRDRERPAANPGRGMLPPKLAQILINLSLIPDGGTVYDPFSGTGTIPMEALLLGHPIIASDVSPAQCERTKQNLRWVWQEMLSTAQPPFRVFSQDIVTHPPRTPPASVDAVITEGWLGPPRTHPPTLSAAQNTFRAVHRRLTAMLQNVRFILKPHATVLTTVPAFRMGKRIVRAPFLSSGVDRFPPPPYTREGLVPPEWDHPVFRGSGHGTLLYGRPDAMVLRDILRLRLSR